MKTERPQISDPEPQTSSLIAKAVLGTSLSEKNEEVPVVSPPSPQKEVKIEPPIPEKKEAIIVHPKVPREKSWLEIQILQSLSPIQITFLRYKEEGKLPIFFMTIAGIIAMVFGFGYLMQYTFQALGRYETLTKVGLGFVAAAISVGIGFRLSGRGERFKEYASGLIGLGIILNYVMIYFLSDLGDFPTLSSTLMGFLLIVANTGIAIYLALRFEVKMIAVLFLLGGAFAPFYLNSTEDGTWYYLYLWFLTIATCFVSAKINWKTLRYLAFSVSVLLLEIRVFSQSPNSIQFTAYYHLFAYLFFFYSFFDHRHLKHQWAKVDLVILAANLSFFLWNLFSAYESSLPLLGLIYLGNAAVFILAYLRFLPSWIKHSWVSFGRLKASYSFIWVSSMDWNG